jgi:dihydrofolate reductase
MHVVLMQFSSLDGVTQGPGSPDEDTSDGFERGGWFVPYLDEVFIEITRRWVETADAYLFGRRTYTAFARDWPQMPDLDDPVARSLNARPKYVASTTLSDAEATWAPTTVLRGDVSAAVAELKDRPGRDLQIHGSTTLGRHLLDLGLVDELRLAVAPVIVGDGRRLFERSDHATGLRLVGSTATPAGLAVNTYAVSGPAAVGTYDPAVHTNPGRG